MLLLFYATDHERKKSERIATGPELPVICKVYEKFVHHFMPQACPQDSRHPQNPYEEYGGLVSTS